VTVTILSPNPKSLSNLKVRDLMRSQKAKRIDLTELEQAQHGAPDDPVIDTE